MKRCILCLYLLVCSLYADTKGIDIELRERSDVLEILLKFENTYDKPPYLTKQDAYKGVIFPDLQMRAYNKQFKNFFINEVQIFNIQNNLYVLGVGDTQNIDVSVSKAPYAIKVTFQKATPIPNELDTLLSTAYSPKLPDVSMQPKATPLQNEIFNSPLSFKDDMGIDTWRYIAVLVVMALLVLILWVVKRYVVHKKQFRDYFTSMAQKSEVFNPTKIEVIAQKVLDSKHKILTLESNGYRYLILIGATSTTLIDRYPIPQNITKEEQSLFNDQFAKLLEQKQERLSKYLHNNHNSKE
ncbi:flagellar biosynthetic protein FliO [Helicobacter marmotae]|uniref:flagellar biosynthetic protein FliO n=1 Tax=Helicobacter marmotae TaxID=152490 RepID=UPI001F3B3469|nr:flagellar biosynthetic protein FliO [Helicobacter marmotae]